MRYRMKGNTLADIDLTTPDAIKHIYETSFPLRHDREGWKGWLSKYVQVIEKVRSASVMNWHRPHSSANFGKLRTFPARACVRFR